MMIWNASPQDARARKELAAWLPPRLFDVHAHVYRRTDLGTPIPEGLRTGPEQVDLAAYRGAVQELLGRESLGGALLMAYPTASGDLERANEHVLVQARSDSDVRASLLISPHMDRAGCEALVQDPLVAGLKPYHVFSDHTPTCQAPLESYAPEWIWELAARRRLLITLHLVGDGALADPDNQEALRRLCDRYPEARVILAHAGRGFHVPNTRRGIEAVRELPNVWYDSSGLCEAEPLAAVLETVGPGRLLWGSDFPVSHTRGRCVAVGDGLAWLDERTVAWDKVSPLCSPILVGLESLRALKGAAEQLGLRRQDLERIFWSNAARLVGLEEEHVGVTGALYTHAKDRIPGGVQLLSKRPEMHAPGAWPAYFREARGCEVEDPDGRHFYDMSSASVGACLLGFGHPAVSAAVRRRVALGSMCALSPPEEVELADRLCALHPWAEQVRLTRAGGETAAVAVRIARATTDRSVVAVCGYHGWHDWYLAANLGEEDALRGHLLPGLEPLGVPRELRGTTLTFRLNDREQFDAALTLARDRLAAVVMEPCRSRDPDPGFLEYVRDRVHAVGALLVFDEITIGWRLCLGGAHLRLGVNPDIAFFAKALGNGHPIGAVIGTREAMHGAHGSFISSTYWTEGVGPAAALATLEVMEGTDVPAHVARVGERVREVWRRCASAHALPVRCEDGYACLPRFRFEHPESEALRTLFTRLMLERGFLAGTAVSPTLAHTDRVIGQYQNAVDAAFAPMAAALARKDIGSALHGPVAHAGFRRLVR